MAQRSAARSSFFGASSKAARVRTGRQRTAQRRWEEWIDRLWVAPWIRGAPVRRRHGPIGLCQRPCVRICSRTHRFQSGVVARLLTVSHC